MSDHPAPHANSPEFAAERRELETVLESGIFAPSSNAAKLLCFVCERYFQSREEPVSEYDVALSALGRRQDFDPQVDSIVRVEAHRVRKRLQEYYAHEGASNVVKIELVRGRYVPRFLFAEGQLADENVAAEPEPPNLAGPPRRLAKQRWAVAGVILLLLVLGVWLRLPRPRAETPVLMTTPDAAPAGQGTVRILAGLATGEYTDHSGRHWLADRYYTGGTAANMHYYSLALADDPVIYQHSRSGEEFSYDIPLPPGLYELHLMFAETSEVAILDSAGDGARSFVVMANGTQILPPPDGRHMPTFDIVADAGGLNTADVKVMRDLTPAQDGMLHLRFQGRNHHALLNAIEILPGVKGRMRPVRWRAAVTPYADHSGKVWLADRYYRGGRLSAFHAAVKGTPDPGLYEGERFGAFTYSVPVIAGDTYTVQLHFAENYFGGLAAPARHRRAFNVYANHVLLLHDFNITLEVGAPQTALTRAFHGVKPNSFDKIVLAFEPATDFAVLNAISVETEAK